MTRAREDDAGKMSILHSQRFVAGPTGLLGLILVLPCIAAPRAEPQVRPRPLAAPVTWVVPANRVAIVCTDCGPGATLPEWTVALGKRLYDSGFEAIVSSEPPADPAADPPFLAILDTRESSGPEAASLLSNPAVRPSRPPVPIVRIPAPVQGPRLEAALIRLADLIALPASSPRPVRYLVVTSQGSDSGRRLFVQVSWVAAYAHLDADFLDSTNVGRITERWLERYTAVVLATDRFPRGDVERFGRLLGGFQNRGGGIAALAGVSDEALYPLFGIRAQRWDAHQVIAFSCDPKWFHGTSGVAFTLWTDPDVLPDLTLDPGQRMLCTGMTRERLVVPLAMTIPRGAGRSFYWNGSFLADKVLRGLILLGITEAAAPAAAAILDAKVLFVDDCPMPMWGTKTPPVAQLYDMTDDQFYTKIWYPRMTDLFQQHGVRPTFSFMLTYDRNVQPPFEATGYTGSPKDPATALAWKIRDAGHEIGLHGYNHQSLAVTKNDLTVGWPGLAAMTEALVFTRSEMKRILGNAGIPKVYVATNNQVQAVGKEAVRKAFPEILGIGGHYLPDYSAPILGDEFAADPDVEGLIDVPRVSSGYFTDSASRLEVLNALVCPGVLSHFVHPDDIYDAERREGRTFDEMAEGLGTLLKRVDGAYPFLRPLTGSELATRIQAMAGVRLEVVRGPKTLTMKAQGAPKDGVTVFVRTATDTKPRVSGKCTEAYAVPGERRFYYRVGEEPCSIDWE
jgi:hypothetical protein